LSYIRPQVLEEDVATANRIAHVTGLVTAFGHVSARVPGTDSFLIPGRRSPRLAEPDRLLRMDVEGNQTEGDGEPNSEFWIHARIYAARPEVGGVAHVHAPACVVLGQLGQSPRPLHNSGAIPGPAPLFERVGLIRTRELGDQVAACLGGGQAMLLRGHGANTAAADVRLAIVLACLLEEAARYQLDALAAAGGDAMAIRFYDAEETRRVQDELSGKPLERAWEYYAAMATNK
jgi:ribulose-5-phosphate 4-epimerase/fuculose-1-phosphate aldolase